MKKLMFISTIVLFGLLFSRCTIYDYSTYPVSESYENPYWAPDYNTGTRYYYLPDIETYYDLSSREFIYLQNGHWSYSPVLPPYYSDFYLDDCYVVVVSYNTYQPWMHHQYYVSHYPRYYYRDYYDRSNIPFVRGYNENSRSAIYWKESERHRAREWNDEYIHKDRGFKYGQEDKKQQEHWYNEGNKPYRDNNKSDYGKNENPPVENRNTGTRTTNVDANDRAPQPYQGNTGNVPEKSVENKNVERPQSGSTGSRRTVTDNNDDKGKVVTPATPAAPAANTQPTNYYGKTIGQPVKVERRMSAPAGNVSKNVSPAKPAEPTRTRTTNSGGGTTTAPAKSDNTKSSVKTPEVKSPSRRQ